MYFEQCFIGTGIPTLSLPEYKNLIEVAGSPALGMIFCNSSGFPPTRLLWKKNNILLSEEDNGSYEQIQRVVSRALSVYSNILILKDIHGVIGNHVYTCLVGNEVGEVSHLIAVSYNGRILT